MPSPRVLLRIVLIFVLCTDAVLGAWASTRMAVQGLQHAGAVAGEGAHPASHSARPGRSWAQERETPRDSVRGFADQGLQTLQALAAQCDLPEPGDSAHPHEDCDCGGGGACACSCMLTFFPGAVPPAFAARHDLASQYLAPPLLPAVGQGPSRLFRPPIG